MASLSTARRRRGPRRSSTTSPTPTSLSPSPPGPGTRRRPPRGGRATTLSSRTATTCSSSVALLDAAAGAEIAHGAPGAVRPPRLAGAAAVPDEELVRAAPELCRQERSQLVFHLARIFLPREGQPSRDAANVRVDRQ